MDVNLEPVLGPSSRHALARQAAEAKTRGSAVSFALGQADLLAHISSHVSYCPTRCPGPIIMLMRTALCFESRLATRRIGRASAL